MSRYLKVHNVFYGVDVVEFPDVYSDWCDYWIENARDDRAFEVSKEIAEARRRRESHPWDSHDQWHIFPYQDYGSHYENLRGRAKTMLKTLSGSMGKIWVDAVEAGVDPKEMYGIKQLVDKIKSSPLYDSFLLSLDITDIRALAANPDRFITLFNDWDEANEWLPNNPVIAMEIFELPEKYDKLIQEASWEDEVFLDDIVNWIDSMEDAYNSWVDGVPVHDVFV